MSGIGGLARTAVAAGRLAACVATVKAATVKVPRIRRTQGRVRLPGLGAPAEVRWDAHGVPHIYAKSETDLFTVQGYLHAEDRLWQMETQRKLGHGQLAELVGDVALDGDRFVRTLGLGRTARHEAEELDAATTAAVDAYAAGINAYLGHTRRLPPEFRLLGARPRPWGRVDVLVWGKTIGLSLSENWAAELLRGRIAWLAGEEAAERLGIGVPDDQYLTLWGNALGRRPVGRPGSFTGRGSNAWAVHAERTSTGAPLLACDPHLEIDLPGLWYLNHLSAPGFEVIGASLPGAPGVIIGHNERLAWGITNARVDVQDLYLERLGPDRYLREDGWAEVEVVREEIAVRGRSTPHVEEVRLTRHGPLITEFLGAEETGLPGEVRPPGEERAADGGERTGVAFRWTGSDPGGIVGAVLALNRAGDWQAFRAALAGWTTPAQNVVYADVEGNVGYALAGTVPLRAAGDGALPAPGWTGEYEWIGQIPAEDLPHQLNPDDRMVVSANNRIVGDDYPYPLHGEWIADYRAARIRALLERRDRHDVSSFGRIQGDLLSLPGLRLAGMASRLPAETDLQRRARAELERWDGMLTADSVAGAIYWRLRTALVRAVYVDLAEPLGLTPGAGLLTWQPGLDFLDAIATPTVLDRLAANDDAWLPEGRTWGDLLAEVWCGVVEELVEEYGPEVGAWRYGRTHRLVLRHGLDDVPLLGRMLRRGPYPIGGDPDTVCAASVAVGGDAGLTGAGYRQICDPGDWDNSRWILATGQSGRPESPHYADQTDRWLRGEYLPMSWSKERVESEFAARTEFTPDSQTENPSQ